MHTHNVETGQFFLVGVKTAKGIILTGPSSQRLVLDLTDLVWSLMVLTSQVSALLFLNTSLQYSSFSLFHFH